jgi:hypothetical protein
MEGNLTIWRLRIPSDNDFAQLNRHYQEPLGSRCQECNAVLEDIPQELSVEWADGSDCVGDFVYAGTDIVLRKSVADDLHKVATGFTTMSIDFFDHPNLRKPKGKSRAQRVKRIWIPYEGPPLIQLIPTRKVSPNRQSTVEVESTCKTCGTIRFSSILGVEKKNIAMHEKRIAGKGVFINREDLRGDDIFNLAYTQITLCTSNVKEFIEKNNYSNIEFLEYGNLVD